MALSSFTFNPNQLELVLSFDQTTTLTNADLANFTLQNAANNPTVSFALTGSTITSGEGAATQHTISIALSTFRNITIQTFGLTDSSNTFLSTTFPTAVTVPVTTYTPATGAFIRAYTFISPNILRFECLPYSPLNLDPTAITLSSSNTGTPSHTLTGGTVTVNAFFTYLELTESDVAALNAISFNPAVSGQAYLSSTAGAWDEWYVPSPAQTNRFVSGTSEQYSLSAELNLTDTGVLVAENEGVGTPNNRNNISFNADSYVNWSVTSSVVNTPNIDSQGATGVGYGNGLYVYSGSNTFLATSPDGVNWTSRTVGGFSANYKLIAYGNNTFVAVRVNLNVAQTSSDGVTWTQRTLPISGSWNGIGFGNGLFVLTSDSTFLTSPDGITWTQRTPPQTARSWNSITFGNGVFVAVANYDLNYDANNIIATSTDGITWTQRTLPTTAFWSSIAFGNGVFVAVANYDSSGELSNIAVTSTDGITWTQRTLPTTAFWSSIAFGGGVFVAIAQNGTVAATSLDGVTWTQQILPVSTTWGGMAYGDDGFVIISSSVTTPVAVVAQASVVDSTTVVDGLLDVSGAAVLRNNVLITDQLLLEGPLGTPDNQNAILVSNENSFIELNATVTTNSLFSDIYVVANVEGFGFSPGFPQTVAIGTASYALYSADGRQWGQATLPTTLNSPTLAYGSNPPRFVALDAGSDVFLTTDNITTWTQRTLPVVGDWYVLKYLNGSFYALDDSSNVLLVSTDGITWTQQTRPIPSRDIAFGNDVYLLFTNSSTYYTSTDAITWTSRTLPFSFSFVSVAFGNGLFVVLGALNTLLTSPDGINWTERTLVSSGSSSFSRIAFVNNLFLVSGLNVATLAVSADGINWTLPTTRASLNYTSYFSDFAGSSYRRYIVAISSGDQQSIRFAPTQLSSTIIDNQVQINGATTITGDVAISGELTSYNEFNLGQLSNLRVSTDGINAGTYVIPDVDNRLRYYMPNAWGLLADIGIGDVFVGSAVGTTAAGDTTTTPPNVTDSGGGNPAAAPAGTYRCLGGIGVNQCLWVRTA